MPPLSDAYPDFREALTDQFGRPSAARGPDVPGGSFGRVLAAFLGRTLADRATVGILDALHDAGLLDPDALASAEPAELLAAVGSREGSAPKWLAPTQRLARLVADRGGSDALDESATESLREELRAIKGLGPAAADAILLALGRAAYPVDRPSYRVLARHGWVDPTADYDEARAAVEALAPDDAAAMADLSGWLERVAAQWCKPVSPRCERCPLMPWLPPSGPVEPDG